MSQTPGPFPARETYDAAAARYARLATAHWRWAAEHTVDSLRLAPVSRVLDVGSGPGIVSLTAGPRLTAGHILGVDLSPAMVELARTAVRDAGLLNADFVVADMDKLGGMFGPAAYEGVTSVFSLFFAPDIPAAVDAMWSLTAPGGRLAITTLGPAFFAPVFGIHLAALTRELGRTPDIPWQRTATPDALARLYHQAGAPIPEIRSETRPIPLPAPDAWWEIVQGTGIRGLMTDLDAAAIERIREHTATEIANQRLRAVQLEALYAVATKP